ncbi:MAG: fatty acid--CoA ligase family protein [Verrucomicrobiota bacterium]
MERSYDWVTKLTMLYERWREIAGQRRAEMALRDTASGRRWTFGELLAAGEQESAPPAGPAFPQGHTPDFIIQLLAAWREKRTVCPLEPGQVPPDELQTADFKFEVPNCVQLKATSATGGVTRLVAFTAEQLAADAENIVVTMGLRADWPNLGVTSMAHSYGFSNLVLPLLLHGVPLILAPAPLPEIVRRAAEKEPAVTLAAVPAMWRTWHEAGAIPATVRLAISAGAPLPLAIEQAVFQTSSVKIHNFLGSSECGGIAFDATDVPRADATCAGAPMRNVSLSVNADGCLVVRSRAVGETYWPEKAAALGGGIFQTSDLAELRDGLVFLRGRLGDQINVAGRKFSPETVERALLTHPRVRECLVFGAPSGDAGRLETVVAVVASELAEGELKQFLLQRLPAWQVPRAWRFVAALPVNARGKLSRAEWRERYAKETFRD